MHRINLENLYTDLWKVITMGEESTMKYEEETPLYSKYFYIFCNFYSEHTGL